MTIHSSFDSDKLFVCALFRYLTITKDDNEV